MTYEQDPNLRRRNEESSALAWKLGIAVAISIAVLIVYRFNANTFKTVANRPAVTSEMTTGAETTNRLARPVNSAPSKDGNR